MGWQPTQGGWRDSFFLFFNFMPVVGWSNIVLVFSVQPLVQWWYVWVYHSYSLLDSFVSEVITEARAEFQVLNISSLWMNGWWMGGKNKNNPCGLYITDTDFCGYVSPHTPNSFLALQFVCLCFFFFWTVCLNSQSFFLCCKLVRMYLFVLPRGDIYAIVT